jgi:tetratricopeptide (TPR) repeat protein
MSLFLGIAEMEAGEHDAADRLLREFLELRRQIGQGNSPWAAQDHYWVALNLTMNGHTQDAEKVFGGAPRFEEVRAEGTSANRYAKMLSRGRAKNLLAERRADDALATLRDAVPAQNDFPSDWTDYHATLGEALCAAGRYGEGLGNLKQAVAADEPTNFAHAPWLARRRALIGLCAAGMGDRRTAMRYATQAREDFVAQSEVSPYYKAPLIKLERALGLKLPPV